MKKFLCVGILLFSVVEANAKCSILRGDHVIDVEPEQIRYTDRLNGSGDKACTNAKAQVGGYGAKKSDTQDSKAVRQSSDKVLPLAN